MPDLAETRECYLKLVRPLLSDGAFEKTAVTTRSFESGKGKELQTALQQFAAEVETSWLIDAWLGSYLRMCIPLPSASNVGLNIQIQGKDLAEWISALAAVCAGYYHQCILVPQTPQGTPVCMEQWKILQDAARVPQKEVDDFYFSLNGSHHTGVLHNGFYHCIAVPDEQFEAYHPDAFRQTFEEILFDTHQNKYPVAVSYYLGGNETACVYQTLQQYDDSTHLLKHIEQGLFRISVSSEDLDADSDLVQTIFQPKQNAWCYKPATYRYNTSIERLYLRCEHIWADGGAFKGIAALAVAKLTALGGKKTRPAVHRYEWQLDADLRRNWTQWQ